MLLLASRPITWQTSVNYVLLLVSDNGPAKEVWPVGDLVCVTVGCLLCFWNLLHSTEVSLSYTFSGCATSVCVRCTSNFRLSSHATQSPNCVLVAFISPHHSLTSYINILHFSWPLTLLTEVWRAVLRWVCTICQCAVQITLVSLCRSWWTSPCYIASICRRFCNVLCIHW